jgi:hypothetical protein
VRSAPPTYRRAKYKPRGQIRIELAYYDSAWASWRRFDIPVDRYDHRVIMYFVETKATSRLPDFGHLPLNIYLSVGCIAAVATELRGIKIYSFL